MSHTYFEANADLEYSSHPLFFSVGLAPESTLLHSKAAFLGRNKISFLFCMLF